MVQIVEPTTLTDACDAMRASDGEAKFLGGGSALVLLMQMGLLAPRQLVSLRRITDVPHWNDIQFDQGAVRIGGGVAMERISRSPLVRHHARGVAEAAAVVGNIRIRNVATLGGLMAEADYASDPPAALVSTDASVSLSNGRRVRELSVSEFIEDFFTTALEEDEVVIAINIPVDRDTRRSMYRKFCARSAEDRPCVGTAVSVTLEDGVVADLRIVIGAVAGTPQSFPSIIEPHLGAELTPRAAAEIAESYAEAIDPIEDVRGTSWYRRQVIYAEIIRALAHTN